MNPMTLNKRSEEILEAVIDSFVKNGSPVSSGWLYKNHNFGIKPAMIRHELENLTEIGYLEQPYHSAGRVPSNKGYKFLVEKILEQDQQGEISDEIEKFFKNCAWLDLVEIFSNQLRILGALGFLPESRIYKTGLENLIDHISLENINSVKSIIRDFEDLDSRFEKNFNLAQSNKDIQVFIGEKSPFTESRDLSIITQRCKTNESEILLIAIGPRRMNYKKVVKTFRGIKKINE